ncbi:MarR family winged helix-turn-helix transcriptional regulator [Romboutsia maritimum]|nr:MarR family transcriptional regulator [Romboutsia maritimum]
MEKDRCENIGKYISQLYRKGSSFIAKGLSSEGIGSGQLMFLLELYRQDGITQDDLTERLNIDKGTTARALKKLEEKEIIVRLKNERDKRVNNIYLTDKGIDAKYRVYKVLDEWDGVLSQNLTIEEKKIVLELLKKICINQNTKMGG